MLRKVLKVWKQNPKVSKTQLNKKKCLDIVHCSTSFDFYYHTCKYRVVVCFAILIMIFSPRTVCFAMHT